MDVLNKFYSSMTSKVSQFSGAVLGNPVTREFEATQFIATAGPGLLWKVYKGFKKSTKQEVAIFILEKKQLENIQNPEVVLETFKRGIIQLTKLRHPNILTVQYSLEESRDCLAFASEPILCSLANALGDLGSIGNAVGDLFSNYNLLEMEIKYGLLNIIEGLAFLHNDVKLIHNNICPQSIIINQKGAWKIFGFDVCIINTSPVGQQESWSFVEYSPKQNHLTQPMLDYLAPENILSKRVCCASDIYSLGMLIYVLFNTDHQPLGKIGTNFSKYKMFASEIRNKPPPGMNCVPKELQDFAKLMLNPIPELRPDLHQLSQAPYFEDVAIITLKYIDSLVQMDNMQRSKFFKSLIPIIQTLPQKVNVTRVLPCLLNEFSNTQMLPFVLPNVLLIAESCETSVYVNLILPAIRPVMQIQNPVQVQVILMNKIEFLLKITPSEDVKNDLLPMVYRALDIDVQQIQELSLNTLPSMVQLIDYTVMKNAVIPRIRKLCLSTRDVSMKVKGLLCLSKLVEAMEKWLISEEVVPFLLQLPLKEAPVLMAVLGILTMVMNNSKQGINNDILVNKVLPFLLTPTLDNTLTVNQFNTLIGLIKLMIQKLESDQRATLVQLNRNNVDTTEKSLPLGSEKPAVLPIMDLFPSNSSHSPNATAMPMPPPPTSLAQLSNLPINISNRDSLSFEDKQRIAKQQEQIRSMSQQYPLSASQSVQSTTSSKVTAHGSLSNTPSFYDALPNIFTETSNNSLCRLQDTTSKKDLPEEKRDFFTQSVSSAHSSWGTLNNNVNSQWVTTKSDQEWSAFETLLSKSSKVNNNETKKPVLENEMIDLLS